MIKVRYCPTIKLFQFSIANLSNGAYEFLGLRNLESVMKIGITCNTKINWEWIIDHPNQEFIL